MNHAKDAILEEEGFDEEDFEVVCGEDLYDYIRDIMSDAWNILVLTTQVHLINFDANLYNNMPTTATSYDGEVRDISRFYEDRQINLSIDAAVKHMTIQLFILEVIMVLELINTADPQAFRVGINPHF